MSTQTHDVAMHPGQRVTLTFRPEDLKGHSAPVQGTPDNAVTTPEADNPIVSTTVSEDGMTVTVHASGPLGTQQLSVTTTGDADLSGDLGNTDPAPLPGRGGAGHAQRLRDAARGDGRGARARHRRGRRRPVDPHSPPPRPGRSGSGAQPAPARPLSRVRPGFLF